MRKLASIRKVTQIKPIEGADAIEAFQVDGWWVVDKKGAHNVGDLVVYLEIDSWVPHELAPFLSKGKEPSEYNGIKGERLRTIRLRGQVSQGLLLSLRDPVVYKALLGSNDWYEGQDFTELLGIQKWEPPMPTQLQGKAKGNFPTHLVPKTDQERIQNCFKKIQERAKRLPTETVWDPVLQRLNEQPVVVPEDFKEPTYEVTMKLDGSSMTVFRWEGELRVCSRNLELKIEEDNMSNSFVAMAVKIGEKVKDGLAFQGELMGPGIQGNREGFSEYKFFVFDVFDIQRQEYLSPLNRHHVVEFHELDHVPVLGADWKAPATVEEGLALAEGPSINHKTREGLVWKCNEDPSFSFKTISNQFLLKIGD